MEQSTKQTTMKEKIHKITRHKTTLRFLGLLLLAGICNRLTKVPNTFWATIMFCSNALIYIGLCIRWIQTVYERLLPTRVRSYIITAGSLMIFYLLIRTFKYRIVVNAAIPHRYAKYAYFIPIIMIPTLFLISAIHFLLGESQRGKRCEIASLAVACTLSAFVLTNDIHKLVYQPIADAVDFSLHSGTYKYGILFIVNYIWVFFAGVGGICMLYIVMRKENKKIGIFLTVVILLWISIKIIDTLWLTPQNIPRMYHNTEIDCFSMLLVFECCIRSRLIPYNENYGGFFRQMNLPVLITDTNMRIAYATDMPIGASRQELEEAFVAPKYLDEDHLLSCMTIQSGYTFWLEDEQELHKEKKRLDRANQILSEENDLLRLEKELQEEKAHQDAQNRIYERITTLIFPKQQKIEELLGTVDPASPAFQKALGISCVLNAYSKRKSNLLLLPEDTLPRRNRELFLALAESCRFLKCCGIEAAPVGEEYAQFPIPVIHELYDTFETVLEAYLSLLKTMTVSIMPDGIRMAMEVKQLIELPDTSLPVICKESDGILFCTIRIRMGGEA